MKLTLKYKINKESYIKASYLYNRYYRKKSYYCFVVAMSLLFAGEFYLFLGNCEDVERIFFSIIGLIVGLIFGVAFYYILCKIKNNKVFKVKKIGEEEIITEIDDEKICTKTKKATVILSVKDGEILKIEDNVIYLFFNKEFAHIIPVDAFNSKEEYEEFIKIFKK